MSSGHSEDLEGGEAHEGQGSSVGHGEEERGGHEEGREGYLCQEAA